MCHGHGSNNILLAASFRFCRPRCACLPSFCVQLDSSADLQSMRVSSVWHCLALSCLCGQTEQIECTTPSSAAEEDSSAAGPAFLARSRVTIFTTTKAAGQELSVLKAASSYKDQLAMRDLQAQSCLDAGLACQQVWASPSQGLQTKPRTFRLLCQTSQALFGCGSWHT